ncbi:MAG: hypothetical protein GC179_09340 [Anaerolineaceae bacterium]|nr:hypothetical protein [Anaerolineaceae bacterium]
MRRYLWMIGLVVGLMMAAVTVPVLAQSSFPNRADKYINDLNGMMSSDLEGRLKGWLLELKSQHNIEMTVLTVNSIRDFKTSDYGTSDTSIEAFATHVFNRWGVGDSATNKGVMLIVAKSDRKVRIELGDGYGTRYNKGAQDVINEYILPYFKKDNYETGIEKGVRATIFMLTDAWPTGAAPTFMEQVGDSLAQVDPIAWVIAVGALVLGIGGTVWYRESHRCPMCGKIDLDIQSNVISSPTYYSQGQKEVHKYCPNCQWSDTSLVAIAMLTQSSSSDSGGSGSSSSSGGGHSSGGGASGSW